MGKVGRINRQERILKLVSWVMLALVFVVFLVPLIWQEKFCFSLINYAMFVGGLAGPLAALVGFIYVYLTFLGQQTQLDEQRERLDREEASKEFAEYLNLWIEFRSKVKYTWNKESGAKAFDSYWKNVRKAVKGDSKKELGFDINSPKGFKESLLHHLSNSSFNTSTGQYDTFKKLVYPLLEMAERGKLESKIQYLENLLSEGEKAVLIYSASFIDKKGFAISLFKSGFCKSIPDDYLISKEHRDLIF
ncbi:hypothetical protein ACPUEN_11645 [Algoriphagus yeomjeoni]|uniref:hypothetical protein n=1 Tax=Algoriphagus yeomjeoni TaxID=291403 RepID=UPI003CE55403